MAGSRGCLDRSSSNHARICRDEIAWRDGEISFAEQRRRRLRDVLPLLGEPVGGDDDLDQLFTGYLHAYEATWWPYPDVTRCLTTFREQGSRLAVLSNGSDSRSARD